MNFFAKASQWLVESAHVATVDWAALAAKGKDSVFSTAYMDEYLLPAFQRADKVMQTLDVRHGTDTAVLEDYFHVRDLLSDEADTLLQVAGTSVQLSNPILAPTVLASVYNNIIWYLWAMALTGANMHITAQIHKSGMSEADIAYHASLTTMMFNVIARLDDFGLLRPLKKSGMSGVPLAVVLVLGAVLIVAIAWAVVAIYEAAQRNELVKTMCSKQAESGDPEAIERCAKIFGTTEGSIAAQVPKAVGDVVEKVAIAAMVGAGAYLLVLFGPGIATKVKQTMAAWRAG